MNVLAPTLEKLGDASFILYHILTEYYAKIVADEPNAFAKFKAIVELPEGNVVESAAKAVILAKTLYNEVGAESKNNDEACAKLDSIADPANNTIKIKPKVNELGKKLFCDPRLESIQLYFFYLFRDESKIQNVCKWLAFLNENGLNEYSISVSEDGADMFRPVYAINPQNPLHAYYRGMCDAVRASTQHIIDYVTRTLNGISSNERLHRVGILRMVLVSVLYYEYFVKNVVCDKAEAAIVGGLRGLLNISDTELPAFTFFALGQLTAQRAAKYISHLKPQQADNIPNLDPLYSTFSVNGRANTDGMFSRK